MSSRLLFLTLLFGACADLERGPRPEMPEAGVAEGGGGDRGAGAAFASVRPVLVADCASCHAAGREAGSSSFLLGTDPGADYRSVRPLVEPANPAASRLLVKGAGQGHQGGMIWAAGSSEHSAVLAWIAGGANP